MSDTRGRRVQAARLMFVQSLCILAITKFSHRGTEAQSKEIKGTVCLLVESDLCVSVPLWLIL